MQALRPVFRPVLQRQLLGQSNLFLRQAFRAADPIRRWQHDQYGPHKEYFQTPGQAPLPDTTPYQPGEQIHVAPTNHARSRLNRTIRSIGWMLLFYFLGVGAGAAVNTWSYIQPPYEQGSEEEQEILDEIEDMMANNGVAQDLKEQGYVEEEFYTRRPRSAQDAGHNLVHETLRGHSQGLSVKVFRNPETKYTFVLFFVGFGMDGFPDIMHGGITATMMLEAAIKHASFFTPPGELKADQPVISVDYRKPVRPGEIYTIMMPPLSAETMQDRRSVMLKVSTHLLRIESAPKIIVTKKGVGQEEHAIELKTTIGKDPNVAQGTVALEWRLSDLPRPFDPPSLPSLPLPPFPPEDGQDDP
jgi:hypothetical protein